MLRPGDALSRSSAACTGSRAGTGPFLTDSGGYQVFSLAKLRQLTEEGVRFQSHLDGSRAPAHPRALDGGADEPGRGHRHGLRRVPALPRAAGGGGGGDGAHHALGAAQPRRAPPRRPVAVRHRAGRRAPRPARAERARRSSPSASPGYAIGGLSVGEPKEDMLRVLDHLDPILPADRPRYLMGVGTPEDLVEAVARGHRHVRLRAAHPQRPQRPALHLARASSRSATRRYRADPAPARPRLRAASPAAPPAAPTCATCTWRGR